MKKYGEIDEKGPLRNRERDMGREKEREGLTWDSKKFSGDPNE